MCGEGRSDWQRSCPQVQVRKQLYPTPEELFNALKDGSVDAIYCDAVTAGHLMEMHGTTKFKQAVLQPFTYSFTLGVGPGRINVWPGILDKSIRCISVKEVEEMFIQSRVERTATVRNLLERLPIWLMRLDLPCSCWPWLQVWRCAALTQAPVQEKLAVMEQAAATRQDKLHVDPGKSVEGKEPFLCQHQPIYGPL